MDLYLAYKAAAEYFAGVPLLHGITRPDFNTRVSTLWLPALGEPGHYTEQGRRFDSVVKHLFGGDLPLRLQGLRQLRDRQRCAPRRHSRRTTPKRCLHVGAA